MTFEKSEVSFPKILNIEVIPSGRSSVLQIRVFRMAGYFSSERSKDDYEQGG